MLRHAGYEIPFDDAACSEHLGTPSLNFDRCWQSVVSDIESRRSASCSMDKNDCSMVLGLWLRERLNPYILGGPWNENDLGLSVILIFELRLM